MSGQNSPVYPDMMTPETRDHAARCDYCKWLIGGSVALCEYAEGCECGGADHASCAYENGFTVPLGTTTPAAAVDPAEDQAPAASAEADLPLHEIIRPAADETTFDGFTPAPAAVDQAPAAVDQAPAADAPVQLFAADWPYPELSAADFSALYTAAAGHIRARGYYAYEVQGHADEPGLSITGALKLAALEHVTAAEPAATHDQHMNSMHDVTEELETRLSAVLYVFGQAHNRTGINDLSDVHVSWSLGHFSSAASGPHTKYAAPTAAYALALLEQAARMFSHIADDTAPVTEAPAPTRM